MPRIDPAKFALLARRVKEAKADVTKAHDEKMSAEESFTAARTRQWEAEAELSRYVNECSE